MFVCAVCFVLPLLFQDVFTTNNTAFSTRLVKTLLENYDPRIHPVRNAGENVSIAVNIGLRQLMELDEKNQVIKLNIWMRLWWNDPFLSWNKSEYGNITQIILPFANVWTPDITLFDSASSVMMPGRTEYRPIVSHTGSVNYLFSTIVDSVCRVNVQYFPIDTQVCPLKFASWSYSGVEIDLYPKTPTADTDFYITHNEWDMDSALARRNVMYYKCCTEPFPDVTFYIKIRRKPFFYLVSVLFPCMLTSSIATLGFLLPPECGEKISLNVTVLLSLAVFLLMVTDQLPASSEHFPYVGMYMASLMSLVALSLLMTVLVLNIHFKQSFGNRVPPWMRKIFIQYLGFCFGRNWRKASYKKSSNTYKSEFKANERSILCNSEKNVNNSTREPVACRIGGFGQEIIDAGEEHDVGDDEALNRIDVNEWHEVAIIMDRLFLVLFIIFTVTPTALFLSLMASG
ncbi:neuronal acetylcholine receptor subunit alpha-7-like [Ostrea edulis]|uniref:neuronal acetylcholine receptor subunit alpha-7-like n=1 Tax=Ostrea edulis TaxID=37623 RepID=UPI002096609F|nr:neuronal acetylcholine receptor subunit alpha-7-like [Ostrea edulis]XP_056021078.1 neuronal acetylcholine receptor subunit alpha-7-like [Ostrea edulis]